MKKKNNNSSWHRLDNAANVFPLISHENFSNVFRLAAELKEPVNPEILQRSLDLTLNAFGNFNFRIRRGFFWFYFEPIKTQLKVHEESLRPCAFIDTYGKQQHLLRVVYYKNRISLEVFHVLTDGTGAVNFLKALVMNYLALLDGEEIVIEEPRRMLHTELEDSYKKYSQKELKRSIRLAKAFRLKGKLLPVTTIGVMHGYFSADELLAHCRTKGVTITEYITSVYVWAIYQANQVNGLMKKPIQLAVPVNLRKFFESSTQMNFFSHITVSVDMTQRALSFDEILALIHDQFKEKITKEKMIASISKDVAMRENIATRALPLVLKTFFVKMVHWVSVQSYTSTLSNVGKIDMPERWEDRIRHFELLMTTSALDPMKCALCAYRDQLIVTLSSQLKDPEIQKIFFRKVAEDGLNVVVETNGAFYEVL